MLARQCGILRTYSRCVGNFVRKLSSNSSDEIIIQSKAPKTEIPKGSFTSTIFRDLDKFWSRTAIECSVRGTSYTFGEVAEQISRWSGFLKEFGLTSKDTVTMIAPNCMAFTPLFFGTASAGIPFSPINAKYTPGEIKRLLEVTGSKFIIYSQEIEENVSATLKEDINNYHLFCIGKPSKLKAQNVEDILYGKQGVSNLQPTQIGGEETCYIPFSSGTTGTPKAVEISHNALSAALLSLINPYHNLTWVPEGQEQSVILGMLPFYHVLGCFGILSFGLLTGAKTIIIPSFSPEAFVNGIPKHKVDILHLVPTLFNLLTNAPSCTADSLKNIHSIFCSAASLLPSYVDPFRKKFGGDIDILEGYGMTEVMITHMTPRRYKYAPGCGALLSNAEAKIISSENGKTLGPNQLGEICIRSPSTMSGYLGNPKATEETIIDGWVHSGDIAYYDEKELFYLIDRNKDLIKVQGMQVSPSEIETEIHKHPLVAECSVIGKPDDRYGELPFAFIVPKQEVSTEEIKKFLEDKLSRHKQLHGGVKFVQTLPKSETGKVLRRKLREML